MMALLALAGGGCADLRGAGGAAAGAAPADRASPADPLIAFAAQARPGAEATVTDPATGAALRVRLVRAYAAASGRECRELAVLGFAATGGERRRLVCRGEGGRWAEARARGGARRPPPPGGPPRALLRSGLAAAPGGPAVP
ncbi:DVU3141 family protein [Caldovatus aquaticus]|uniref:Surface antigen domain-containing protein n=1 Tax=Caldovatus aquaticus TaxID=2865671 RepID=A0ABS7F5M8_9PROT|nr:DVU3141 family protein [Caldovatus aquaticus]MBW8270085.1 hypothetical protein [Caldovatus aquaticus]